MTKNVSIIAAGFISLAAAITGLVFYKKRRKHC